MKIHVIKKIAIGVCLALFFGGSPFRPASGNGEPQVRQVWKDWIKNNHHNILSLSPEMNVFPDLQFLKPLLQGKTLVQLGESGHGVSEFNKAKVRLIKFLHEEMGYDVIAFESSIFECFQADSQADSLTAEDMMGYSIFQVWHCEETLELFRYIKETKKTSHPLILAGFDVQTSSTAGSKRRPAAFKSIIAKIDKNYAEEVFQQDQIFLANQKVTGWITNNGLQFRSFFGRLVQWFDSHRDELSPFYSQTLLIPKILRRTAWSMIPFIDELMSTGNDRTNYRDKGMADNIGFLAQEVFPDKKIMIWAHNYHVQYNNADPQGVDGCINMGDWLAQRHRPQLYTIGLFMYGGEAANNDRSVYAVTPAAPDSLEAIFYNTGFRYSFVDMLNCGNTAGSSWMFTNITAKSWGLYDESIVPREQYDAVLFIKTVHPPHYVSYYASQDQNVSPNPDFSTRR